MPWSCTQMPPRRTASANVVLGQPAPASYSWRLHHRTTQAGPPPRNDTMQARECGVGGASGKRRTRTEQGERFRDVGSAQLGSALAGAGFARPCMRTAKDEEPRRQRRVRNPRRGTTSAARAGRSKHGPPAERRSREAALGFVTPWRARFDGDRGVNQAYTPRCH